MKSLNHGKSYVYTVHRCRCRKCTKAWRLQHRKYMNKPGNKEKHAERQIRRYYNKRFPGKPELQEVYMATYKYKPRKQSEIYPSIPRDFEGFTAEEAGTLIES